MLVTFMVGSATTVLCDDTNSAGTGRFGFNWEEWGVTALVEKRNLWDSDVPDKQSFGNLDRKVGFRAQRSFNDGGQVYADAITALTAFLKAVDAQAGQAGTLTLQPDATLAPTLVYANAILKSASLVGSRESTTGVMITVSYKFEPTTLA